MTKYVYLFSEGNAGMRNLLGGKGANLAEMTGLGMPVPQGFTITTEACTQYYNDGEQINAEIQEQIYAHIKKLEEISGKKWLRASQRRQTIRVLHTIRIAASYRCIPMSLWKSARSILKSS